MSNAETAFKSFMGKQGWEVSRGFPDYFCFQDGEFMLVEVKQRTSESLQPRQLKVMEALASCKVKCLRWSPDTFTLLPFDNIVPKKREKLRVSSTEIRSMKLAEISMETTAVDKRTVGFYICWGCHQQFPLYEGSRRRYCPVCELQRKKALAGTRKSFVGFKN